MPPKMVVALNAPPAQNPNSLLFFSILYVDESLAACVAVVAASIDVVDAGVDVVDASGAAFVADVEEVGANVDKEVAADVEALMSAGALPLIACADTEAALADVKTSARHATLSNDRLLNPLMTINYFSPLYSAVYRM
jgi:hypothetical protein